MRVCVVGGGPAGLLAALYAATEWDEVTELTLVDREAPRWDATLCCWDGELEGSWAREELARLCGRDGWVHRSWEECTYVTPDGLVRHRARYLMLSNASIVARVLERLAQRRVRVLRASVTALRRAAAGDGWEVVVASRDDASPRCVAADLVVDCGGHYGALQPRRGGSRGWQCFYGETLACAHGFATHEARVMHWDDADGAATPTFAYVLPMDAATLFVQETVLVGEARAEASMLRGRFAARLGRLGLGERRVVGVEEGAFPMCSTSAVDAPGTLTLGACGGFVNQVTGYHVAHAWRELPWRMEALRRGRAIPAGVPARLVWGAFRRLLEGMDAATQTRFFAAFFRLDPDDVYAFLWRTRRPWQVAAILLRFGLRADARTLRVVASRLPLCTLREAACHLGGARHG